MQDAHMKLNQELPLKRWHSTRRPLASRLDIKLVKYYIWIMVLYGAETWTFGKIDQKYLEKVLEFGAGKGWRRSV
jgi:hypothetical protein